MDNGKGHRNPPDVHIIVLDSVSNSMFMRSMPKTLHELQQGYGAIIFNYLNKIGLNSLPNGQALLFGR
jgi:hypothetical protein